MGIGGVQVQVLVVLLLVKRGQGGNDGAVWVVACGGGRSTGGGQRGGVKAVGSAGLVALGGQGRQHSGARCPSRHKAPTTEPEGCTRDG